MPASSSSGNANMPAKYRRFIIALLAVPLILLLIARCQIADRDRPPPATAPVAVAEPEPATTPADPQCSDDNARRSLALLRSERDHLVSTITFADASDPASLGSMDEAGEALARLTLPECMLGARDSLKRAISGAHSVLGQFRDRDASSFELHGAMQAAMQINLDNAEREFARIDAGMSGKTAPASAALAGKAAPAPDECKGEAARGMIADLRRQRDSIVNAVNFADPSDRYSLGNMDNATSDLGRLQVPACMNNVRSSLSAAARAAHQVLRQHLDDMPAISTFELRDAMRAAMQADTDTADSELTRLDGLAAGK